MTLLKITANMDVAEKGANNFALVNKYLRTRKKFFLLNI